MITGPSTGLVAIAAPKGQRSGGLPRPTRFSALSVAPKRSSGRIWPLKATKSGFALWTVQNSGPPRLLVWREQRTGRAAGHPRGRASGRHVPAHARDRVGAAHGRDHLGAARALRGHGRLRRPPHPGPGRLSRRSGRNFLRRHRCVVAGPVRAATRRARCGFAAAEIESLAEGLSLIHI